MNTDRSYYFFFLTHQIFDGLLYVGFKIHQQFELSKEKSKIKDKTDRKLPNYMSITDTKYGVIQEKENKLLALTV